MQYAPVIIPTLCRFEHFKQCIESLSRCTGAEKTEVYIGLDYPAKESHRDGYNKIRDYLVQAGNMTFKKITVIKREKNLGVGSGGNYDNLKKMILQHYNVFISSEDDNVFSPCFIEFMNACLHHYKDDNRVSSVCGYMPPGLKNNQSDQTVFTTPFVTAWGMGHWKDKDLDLELRMKNAQKMFKSMRWRFRIWAFSPILYRMFCNMVINNRRWGDVAYSVNNIYYQCVQVHPGHSMVRNIGNDGSGINCPKQISSQYINQEISTNRHFKKIVSEKKLAWNVYFMYKLEGTMLKAIFRAFKDLLYVIYPLKLKNI